MRFVSFSALVLTVVFAANPSAEAQSKRSKSAPPAAAVPAQAPAATSTAAPAVSSSEAFRSPELRNIDGRTHGGFKWDAFVDLQLAIPSRTDLNGNIIDRGFSLNDAALFLSKDFGRATALVELPFRSDVSGASNAFMFAESKAQAYVQFAGNQPYMLRAGQFATFFGVEANDSRDRFFADAGFIKELILPKTHMGLQVGYQASAITLRGQITNPADRGVLAQDNPEFAALARFDAGPGYGSLGFSLHDSRAAVNNKTNMLVNLMGGMSFNRLRIDGEIDIRKFAGTDKTANAFGVFGTFGVDDQLAIGGRLEYAKDIVVPAAGTYESLLGFGFGPAYRLQPDLTVRGDLSVGSLKTPAQDDTLFSLNLSLVAEL